MKMFQTVRVLKSSHKEKLTGPEGGGPLMPDSELWLHHVVMATQALYPKQVYGTLNILSWRILTNSRSNKVTLTSYFPTLLPWKRSWNPHVRVALPLSEERILLIFKDMVMLKNQNKQTGLANFPQFTTPASYSLTCHISPRLSTLHQT